MAKRNIGAKNGLFSVPEIIETSVTEAGVGAPDALAGIAGLGPLCDSLAEASDQLHFIGRRRAQRMLVETLVKRLRFENHLASQPEIAAQRLDSPIFLVAPFRSGTTLLHRLLARDPVVRTPRLWEALQAPPIKPEYQGDPAYFEQDYRVEVARRYIEAREKFTPELAVIHPSGVDVPEECFGLLETSLLSHSYMFYAPVISYLAWLDGVEDAQWVDSYRLYADQLRMLQWWGPAERWVLKTPFHMWAVAAIGEVFPDGLIVQQHRDPIKCVASYCSLTAAAYGPIMGKVDPTQVGEIAMGYLERALARNVVARQQMDPARFVDIGFKALMEDPMACVDKVYRAAGLSLSAAAEDAMRAYLDHQRRTHSPSAHQYSLDDYQIDPDRVAEAFAAYDSFADADG